MASVSYRKKGDRWQIRLRHPQKKEIVKSLPGTLYEKTIEQKTTWYREQIALGRIDPWAEDDTPIVLVRDALDEYIFINKDNGNWSESTYTTRKNALKQMLTPISGLLLGNETPQTLFQQVFDDMNGNAHTRRGNRAKINAFLKYCYDEGYLKDHHKVSLPMLYKIEIRNSDEIKYITKEQLNRVCQAIHFIHRQTISSHGRPPEFYTDLLWFMFYSLLRKNEIPRLTAASVIGDRLRVSGKGRRVDVITLPPPAAEIAKRYAAGKRRDEPLFVTDMHRSKVHLGRAIDMALGEDHHSKGFHQLRHGGVVYYLSEKIPIQFVSKLARHKSIQVTLTVYADVIPDKMDEIFSEISPDYFTPNVQKQGENNG